MAELATAYVSLLPSLKGLRKKTVDGVKGAGDAAGKQFSDEFGGEAEKGGKEGGKRFGGALLAAGVAGAALAGAAIAKGLGDALEREKLGDKTAAALGLSEKQSANAGAVAGRLYAGAYGESMADVTSAVESVLSSVEGMSKASPKELEGVTASVLDLATAFDLDVSEAAQNVGILMKQGLAKDATEATDLITAALQKVPVALRGEVGDATQEYTQFFADLGFTGSEAMGLLVSATEDGAYGIDKMGDAIKEFTIRSTDMSKATKDAYTTLGLDSEATTNELLAGGDRAKRAFETIIAGVKGIESPAKQAEVALALFGTPLEDLGTNEIPAFLDGLTGTATSLGNVDGAAATLGTTLNDNLATRLESIKRTVEVFVSGALMSMFTWLDKNKTAITLIASVVLAGALAFGLYNAAIIATRLPLIVATAAQWAMNAALTANPIGLVVVAIGAFVGALVWLYKNNETARKIIDGAWKGIKAAIDFVWKAIKVVFVAWATGWALLWKGVQAVWTAVGKPALDAIQAVFGAVWRWVDKNVLQPFMLGVRVWAMVFGLVKRRFVDPAWDGIQNALRAGWEFVRDKVFAPFKPAVEAIGAVFKATRKVISAAWDGIRAAAAKPINFIIETVYTKGIKATWDKIADSVGLDLALPDVSPIKYATGGVLPGYTPGRDVHQFFSPTGGRLSLSGGEAIMRPEFTRAVGGPAGVAALNSAARSGQAFADGGVFGFAGDLWDSVKGGVSSFLANPAGVLGNLLGKSLGALDSIGGGTIGKIAAQLPRNAVEALLNKAKSLVSTILPTGGTAGPAMGWQAQWNAVKAMFPGAALHSALRPGAITATGFPSYHGQGRAIDITPSMQIFNWLAKAFPNSTELIYSPAGGRQLYKGQQTLFGEPTRGDHWDHIHWAMKNGGVLPKLYDQGGWLPSGGLGVNQTGKPEAVLTPDESRALKSGLGGRGVRDVIFNTTSVKSRDVLFALDVADLLDVGVTA